MKKKSIILIVLAMFFFVACANHSLLEPVAKGITVTIQSPAENSEVHTAFNLTGNINSARELNFMTVYYSINGKTNLIIQNMTGKSNTAFTQYLVVSNAGTLRVWVEAVDMEGKSRVSSNRILVSSPSIPSTNSSASSVNSSSSLSSSVSSSVLSSKSSFSWSSTSSSSSVQSSLSSSVFSSTSSSTSSTTSSSQSSSFLSSSSSSSSSSFSSSSSSVESGITVSIEKPNAWSAVYMWFDEDSDGTWETATLASPPGDMTEYRTGWYKKNFPTAASVTFIFNDGTWNNKLNSVGFNQNGSDFVTTSSVWFSKDGSKSLTDPMQPQPPSFQVSPGSTTFSSDGVQVSVSVNGDNVATAKYTLDGNDPLISGTSFNGSVQVLVGSGLTNGQNASLILYASNSIGTTWVTNVYQKTTPVTNTSDFRDLRMYQVMVATFQDGDPSVGYNDGYGPGPHNGDLQGVYNALPYIKSMGFNAIWMTPVFDSTAGGDYRLNSTGYFANNYFAVDPNFGTWDKLKAVVDRAHELGLYVFLDGVFGHNNGNSIQASPSGYYPQGGNDPVSYPGSLDFYKEVATFWIDQMGIDGWRLDQAYQVNSNPSADTTDGQSYWKDIREAVEQACQTRKSAGKQWGTLGYMVGEIWKGENIINAKGYAQDGLRSCFDFPLRYRIVQALAEEESGTSTGNATSIEDGYSTHSAYPSYAEPNFFVSNHDLARFGDLIQRKFGYGKENPDYWKRHKAMFSFMASYSGPITVYYGDELGEEVPNDGNYYQDNVARSRIDINNLDANETDLTNYVGQMMRLKSQYSALWRGSRQNLISTADIHADLKTDGAQRIVYILNISTSDKTVSISLSGASQLRDLLTGEVVSGSGSFSVFAPALSGRFLIAE